MCDVYNRVWSVINIWSVGTTMRVMKYLKSKKKPYMKQQSILIAVQDILV